MPKKYDHIENLKCCPYCGGETWYRLQTYKGTCEFRTNFDGTEAENDDMYDGVEYKFKDKFAYCTSCNEKIAIAD